MRSRSPCPGEGSGEFGAGDTGRTRRARDRFRYAAGMDHPSAPEVRLARLREGAVVPRYQTEHAAGLDLAAAPEDGEPVGIEPGGIALVGTGLALAIPVGYEGQVRPRSGLSAKHGVTVVNAPGTIDADYRGELRVPLINLGRAPFTVEPGLRIAQLVIAPVAHARVIETDDAESLGETTRGAGGFGSTGI